MKNIFFISLISLLIFSCADSPDKDMAFIQSKYWVEKSVPPEYGELDFPFADFRYDDIKNGEYIIESYFNCNVGKITYRAKIKYKGKGSTDDYNNWELLRLEFPDERY